MLAGHRERPQATLEFQIGWREVQHGEIERAGELIIQYDPGRLTHCRRWWRDALIWNITAHVRFYPGGYEQVGTVLQELRDPPHGPVVGFKPIPFAVLVPPDAEWLAVWFESQDFIGGGCRAWDSRYGQNYWYRVRKD